MTEKISPELRAKLRDAQKRDNDRRIHLKREAVLKGIDPLSLEATSPLTVKWMKQP